MVKKRPRPKVAVRPGRAPITIPRKVDHRADDEALSKIGRAVGVVPAEIGVGMAHPIAEEPQPHAKALSEERSRLPPVPSQVTPKGYEIPGRISP